MKSWVIYDGVSQEARDIVKKLAKEKKVNMGEVLNDLILMHISHTPQKVIRGEVLNDFIHGHISHTPYVENTYSSEQQSIQQKLQELQVNVYNRRMSNAACGNDNPFVLSFGALNQEDMDRKLIEHIFNRLRRNSGKEPVSLPDPDKSWWKFWS